MIVRLIVQNFIWLGAMGVLLFLAAGTIAWPGAWAYLVLMLALSFTLGIDLARHDPGLLRERMGSPVQRDQPAADKMLLIALLLFMFAWLVLMGLDAKRFAWSTVPAVMQVLGALITLWSIWFCYRTMRENSFAAPVIRRAEGDLDRTLRLRPPPDVFRGRFLLHWHRAAARLMVGRHIRFRPDRPPMHPHPDRGKGVARRARGLWRIRRACALSADPACLVDEREPKGFHLDIKGAL